MDGDAPGMSQGPWDLPQGQLGYSRVNSKIGLSEMPLTSYDFRIIL